MKIAIVLAVVAGASVALQVSINAAAQRTLGLAALISISGFATGLAGLVAAMISSSRPEFTGRAITYGMASGVLGCVILASVTYAAVQGGVARALSLLIASQLVFGLVLDFFGVFGAGSGLSLSKLLGVSLIIVGGILVVK